MSFYSDWGHFDFSLASKCHFDPTSESKRLLKLKRTHWRSKSDPPDNSVGQNDSFGFTVCILKQAKPFMLYKCIALHTIIFFYINLFNPIIIVLYRNLAYFRQLSLALVTKVAMHVFAQNLK